MFRAKRAAFDWANAFLARDKGCSTWNMVPFRAPKSHFPVPLDIKEVFHVKQPPPSAKRQRVFDAFCFTWNKCLIASYTNGDGYFVALFVVLHFGFAARSAQDSQRAVKRGIERLERLNGNLLPPARCGVGG